MKKYIAIFGFIILLATVPVTLYLVFQRQELRKKAAVPGGTATFSLSGPTTVAMGQKLPVTLQVLGDTNDDRGIIGVKATLQYSFTGEKPLSITKEDIEEKLADPWSYYLKQVNEENNTVTIVIEAVYLELGEAGYTAAETERQPFAVLNFTALSPATVTIAFIDEKRSEVRAKEQNLDVLNIDLARATFTITAAEGGAPPPTATPTPTQPAGAPPAPTATSGPRAPTSTPTPLPPPAATATAVPATTAVTLSNIRSGQVINDNTPTFSGTAAPGSRITIVVRSEPISGNTAADYSGNWSWTPPAALSPGNHTVTITAADSQGNTSTTTATFTVAGGGNGAPPIATPTVPVTGTVTPVVIVSLLGILLLLLGLAF